MAPEVVETLLGKRAAWQPGQTQGARHLTDDLVGWQARPRRVDRPRPPSQRLILARRGESGGEGQRDIDRDDIRPPW